MATKTAKLGDLVGTNSALKFSENLKMQWVGDASQLLQTRVVRILRVTAVLLADSDGTRATGTPTRGDTVVPADGLLRNPAIHTKAGQNYIDDWISLANKQLFASGADFLLDRQNVQYVFVKDTDVNSTECKGGGQAALDLIAKNQEARFDNPWRDAVLMLFPWGKKAKPSEGGCSDINSPFIKVAANYHDFETSQRFVDGLPILGNNLVTHELGHFLGLVHNFPGTLHQNLFSAFLDPTLNPLGLPMTEANLPKFNGVTKALMAELQKTAKDQIATWKFGLDNDAFNSNSNLFPSTLAITDTPANLGMGLPAMMGNAIGTGNQLYEFARFKVSDMDVPADAVFGTPKPGAKSTKEKVPLNKDVRLNVMGYWYANVFGQTFSKLQVARMQHAVDTVRASMVDRTVTVTVKLSPTGISVTESLFVEPPVMVADLPMKRVAIPDPHPREIEQALARLRRPSTSREVRLGLGNVCAVRDGR